MHKVFLEEELRPLLDEPEEALLRSQAGSLASASLPTLRETTFAPQPFRLLLLRRFAILLSGAGVAVHSIAVVTTGLRVRGRESRATVVTRWSPQWHGLPRGWRTGPHQRHGARPRPWCVRPLGRRLEIIAYGLPSWRGAQLAIDTTLVSPIRADGTARHHPAHRDGVALEEARRTKERKYPELAGNGGRARLVVVAAEVGRAVLC